MKLSIKWPICRKDEGQVMAGCFHIGCTETPEFNHVAIAVLSVADSLAAIEAVRTALSVLIRDGIGEVKIPSVFTCACSTVGYYFGA
ncbi:MAG: hypothetical protein U0997_04460 [Sulfurimicrobium sp.]|nr:hypothetical protein [Sulfurimicrobium sp.]